MSKKETKYTFRFISDSGHGWIECPQSLLSVLNISKEVSSYSYKKDGFVYLEEDCDAGILLKKLKEKNILFELQTHYVNGESEIRSYSRV